LIQLTTTCKTLGGTSGGPNGMNLVGVVPQPPLLELEFGVEVVSQLEHLISKMFFILSKIQSTFAITFKD
jgi:hypothetical protein